MENTKKQSFPPEGRGGVTPDPSDNTTMSDVITSYGDNGFDAEFSVLPGALVQCVTCGSKLAASQFTIHSLRRLEGASDPDDMAAVVATTCPVCDAKGLIVLGYGPTASGDDNDVSLGLRDGRHQAPLPSDASPGDVTQRTELERQIREADIADGEAPTS